VNSAEPMRLSVRDPSSMILQVIWPNLSTSPDFADTKFMGRRGIFMLANACRASSSMMGSRLERGSGTGRPGLIVCFAGLFGKGELE
jgi:hypothetical protein